MTREDYETYRKYQMLIVGEIINVCNNIPKGFIVSSEKEITSVWMRLDLKLRNRLLKKWASLSKSPADVMRASGDGTLFAELPELEAQKSDFEWTRSEDVRPFDLEKWAARFK